MMTSATEAGVGTPQVGAAEERPSLRAWYALGALIVAMLFGFVDARILVLLAQTIKQDLSLTDLQIGETHGLAPAVFAAVSMFPLAWMADRFERRTVMCVCVIFWSLATAASGLATNFTTLLACTIAIVVGETGLSPIVYSLIADLFPPKHRPRANIIAYGATVLGAGLGTAAGGALIGVIDSIRPVLPASIQDLAAWRLAFFLVAVPGPLVALLVFLIGRTKRVVVSGQAREPLAPVGPYLKAHGLVALGAFGTMACFAFGLQAVANWLPVALIRNYNADAGSVGVNFGLYFTAGAAVGLVMATVLTPYLRRLAGTAFVLRAIALAAVAVAVPTLLLAFTTALWQAYILVSFFSASFVTGVALMPGMMQDVAPSALRARVIAGGTVLYMVLGYLSPPLVGFISDQMSGDPRGLMWAMVVTAITGFLACAALALFMEAPYRRTVAAVGA
jgi:MFS family permease